MSSKDQIKTACGWRADFELPFIAERILDHCVDRIKQLEAQQWQPIESAPKDGTYVLLLLAKPRNVIQARWSAMGWTDCWCAYVAPYSPTHWMPLPEAPQEQKDE